MMRLFVTILLMLLITSPSWSEEAGDKYLLSESTYNRLNDIQKQMDDSKYDRAEQDLKVLLGDVEKNAYEKAVVYQTLGYVYSATNKYESAATAFITATEDQALPKEVTHNLYYNIAQLKIHASDYKTGLRYLDKWLADEQNPPVEVHVLAATAYYQLKDFKSLIPHIKTAIEKSERPEKSWYDLLLAAYFETGNFNSAATVLVNILQRHPDNKDYWLQLVSVYQRLDKTSQSLAVMELALEKKLLDDSEIIQLVQMYLQAELPFKAANLLQEKINSGELEHKRDHLELLANSWLLAQETERAVTTLEQLAESGNDPDINYRLGQLYFELERWQDTVDSLNTVASDENFEQRANATLLLGIAAYHLEDYARSGEVFNQALGFDTTRQQAEWWLDKLETIGQSAEQG